MNIIILTPIPFWHPGTQELIDGLKRFGINVRALDIFQGRIIDEKGTLHELKPSFLFGFLGKIYLRLFRNKLIAEQIKEGDIVDIHFLEPAYSRYINVIKREKVKLITTLFGSDLFRTNQLQKKSQQVVFAKSDAIVLSKNMIPYFESYFFGYRKKYRFNQYGSLRLDLVNDLNSSENKRVFREKLGISDEKIVVTCGYNAKKEQQHLQILDGISKLSESQKEKLFLLLPLTYGYEENPNYLKQIKDKVSDLHIPYICFEKKLNDRELAEIRIVSDIMINTQTTDALASSIKEAMTAGDVMLIGDWLPYQIYNDLGVFYLTTSLPELSEKLQDILSRLNEYQEKSKVNAKIILTFASWNVLLEDWIKLYQEI